MFTQQIISTKEATMLMSIYSGHTTANDVAQILQETKQAVSAKKDRLIQLELLDDKPKLQLSEKGKLLIIKMIAQINYEVLVQTLSRGQNLA